MKINMSSWHYWLHRTLKTSMYHKLERGDTTSLCAYFWYTIGAVIHGLMHLLFVIWAIAAGTFVVFAAVNFIVFVVTGILGLPLSWVDMGLAIGTYWFCTVVAVIVSFIAWCRGYVNVLPNYLKPEQAKVGVKPSLFKEYYKAWKAKVCPLVELER